MENKSILVIGAGAVSTKGIMKVGLTMRSPGLGKLGSKKKEAAKK